MLRLFILGFAAFFAAYSGASPNLKYSQGPFACSMMIVLWIFATYLIDIKDAIDRLREPAVASNVTKQPINLPQSVEG